jgi:hypothetical protein
MGQPSDAANRDDHDVDPVGLVREGFPSSEIFQIHGSA